MCSSDLVVIAGHNDAVEKAMVLAKEAKAKRALKLPVSVPSHSSLMTEAASQLGEVLSSIEIKSPEIPVLHNVDGKSHASADEIKQCLQQQLHNPVLWVDTVNNIIAQSVDGIVECGPGKVLAGLNRRIDKSVTNYTIDTIENFNTFKTALGE